MAVLAAGCSPALDWRESRLDVNGVVAMLPCKPVQRDRVVMLDKIATRVDMQSCEADGSVFAVSSADLGDPTRVAAALLSWQSAAAGNVGATAQTVGRSRVPGMTPNEHALVLRMDGHAPDGSVLIEQAAFFSKGARIFQVAVVGRTWRPDAAEIFFDGLRFP